jgi:hypothetical protein
MPIQRTRQINIGIAGILVSLFMLVAPLPFLSETQEGATSFNYPTNMILRLGQDFANPLLVDATLEAKRSGSYKLEIEGLSFEVEIDQSLTHDDIEALVDTIKRPETIKRFATAKRIRFEGWDPTFLPMRIPYRYLMVAALIFGLGSIFILFKQR